MKYHKPMSCQHEGPFEGIETVLTSFGDTDLVVHLKTERCSIEYPHKMNDCNEFDQPLQPMELKKHPFNRDAFVGWQSYEMAKEDFYLKEYKGKTLAFAHDIINLSGSTRHEKGKTVHVTGFKFGCFKVSDSSGELEGLFKPSAFEEVNT